MRTLVLLLSVGVFLSAKPVLARWATPDDAEWATEKLTHDIVVHGDGTTETTTESLVTILRDGARTMSNYRMAYNSRAGELKILSAETINGDKAVPVESEFIEDKPMASRLNGFDQFNLVVVAFPKVTVGSQLHVKYRERHNEVPIPGQYSARFDFGVNWFVKDYRIRIRSEQPLALDKNDPQQKLEITQSQAGSHEFLTEIKLKSPLYTRPIDEPLVSLNRKDMTWVVVSLAKDYGELANRIAPRYEEVLSSKLPPAYEKILEDARAKPGMVERLNTITSELAELVRYMGDWRPVNGGHVPRPLETVAQTRFGDCKDFAAGTVAILRGLGVKAQVAWVERAVQPAPLPSIAYEGAFNHAIVWAQAEGRDWWIDPTNFASFAQGLFADILDRDALVIAPGASRIGRIPAGQARESVRESFARVRLEKSMDASIEQRVRYEGRAAAAYTGALLKQSKEHFDHYLITSVADENRLKWHKIGDYDLRSRVVRDFELSLSWGEREYAMRTTVGPAVYLGSSEIDHVMRLETKARVSDLFLGAPDVVKSTDFLEDVHGLGAKAPECRLSSPWLNVSRKITQTPTGLRVVDTRETKVSRITNAELKSEAFSRFQRELQKCFDRVAVVYEPIKGSRPRAISSEPKRR